MSPTKTDPNTLIFIEGYMEAEEAGCNPQDFFYTTLAAVMLDHLRKPNSQRFLRKDGKIYKKSTNKCVWVVGYGIIEVEGFTQ